MSLFEAPPHVDFDNLPVLTGDPADVVSAEEIRARHMPAMKKEWDKRGDEFIAGYGVLFVTTRTTGFWLRHMDEPSETIFMRAICEGYVETKAEEDAAAAAAQAEADVLADQEYLAGEDPRIEYEASQLQERRAS